LRLFLLSALACACTLAALALPREAPAAPAKLIPDDDLQQQIDGLRKRVWRYERLMGVPLTIALPRPKPPLAERIPIWQAKAAARRRAAAHPPHERAWLCIHRYEGSWTDDGAPYYGGLQMDIGFQATYGGDLLRRKGTANHWTPLEQMWVAEKAFRSGRGFYPWPNTARYCGLL
jgi:hypothetical protein